MKNYTQVVIDNYMRRSEREIHSIFNRYASQLCDRKWELSQGITSWRDTLIRQIEEHAREQKSLLEQEYQKQVNYMEDVRRDFINAARPYEQTGNNEWIDQLLSQCRALKFELAALEFPERAIPSIQFRTEEQLAWQKRDGRKTERTEDNLSRSNLVGSYDNYNMTDSGAYASATSKLVSGHMERTNQPSNTTRSSNKNASPSNSSDNRYTNTNSDNISIDECPVCSMSFPSHMTRPEQATHINAHFQES